MIELSDLEIQQVAGSDGVATAAGVVVGVAAGALVIGTAGGVLVAAAIGGAIWGAGSHYLATRGTNIH